MLTVAACARNEVILYQLAKQLYCAHVRTDIYHLAKQFATLSVSELLVPPVTQLTKYQAW